MLSKGRGERGRKLGEGGLSAIDLRRCELVRASFGLKPVDCFFTGYDFGTVSFEESFVADVGTFSPFVTSSVSIFHKVFWPILFSSVANLIPSTEFANMIESFLKTATSLKQHLSRSLKNVIHINW